MTETPILRKRPSSDPDTSYDPQGFAPALLHCGLDVTDAYWSGRLTAAPWPCCLIHEAWYEYRQEPDEHLTVMAVPAHLEDIPRNLSDPYGPQIAVTDSGPLGGKSFSSQFTRRLGYRFLESDYTVIDSDMRELHPMTWAMEGPLRRKCRSKHSRWADHRGQLVCYLLVRLVVVNGWHVDRAALALELSPERGLEHLERAMRDMWAWRSQVLNGIEMRRPQAVA